MAPTETSPIRHPSEHLMSIDSIPNTPHGILFYAVSRYGNDRCFASRKAVSYSKNMVRSRLGTEVMDGLLINDRVQVKDTLILGEWEYLTYKEVGGIVLELATAMKGLVKGGLHMFGRNSANWLMITHAASMCAIPLVTVYTKLDGWTLTETLVQTRSTAIFVDSDLLEALAESLLECPHVTTIIYNQVTAIGKDLEKTKADITGLQSILGPTLTILRFEELRELGKGLLPTGPGTVTGEHLRQFKYPAPQQDIKEVMWAIMYPLSDGKHSPKGVLMTIGNIMASILSIHHLLKSSVSRYDTYLSYLPPAFMLEYNLNSAFILLGVTIGFGTNSILHLLPPPYSNLEMQCKGDIESFGPSILFGIPPWWDEVHAHVLDAVKEHTSDWQDGFWKAVARKARHVVNHTGMVSTAAIAATDRGRFIRPIREKFFGTRVRWIGVSCSMQAPEKKEFLGAVLCSSGKMVEGFSFMEMSTIVTFMPPSCYDSRSLSSPLPSLEIKLVTVPPYYPAHASPPRGEIYIRGPSVPHMGYHRNPEASIASFLDGGWVKTGTIGEWDSKHPGLKILGTMGPLGERFMGDYVPVESLEAAYEKSNLVRECCVLYSGRKPHPVAVAVVEEVFIRRFCNYHQPDQTPGMYLDELLLSRQLKELVLKELNIVAKSHGLVDFELIGGIILVKDPLPKIPRPQPMLKAESKRGGGHKVIKEGQLGGITVKLDIDRKKVWKVYSAETEHELL